MPDDTRLPAAPGSRSILRDPTRFEFTQRVAKLYAESKLVPQHLRGNLADCFIALQMADAMDEDPLMVMQNIYIVNAKAGWSAQYMISRANRSGHFRGPLRWHSVGQGESLAVTCYADLAHADDGDTRIEVTVTMEMAKLDGWTRNEKYKSIPDQMLRWRSATWLIRLYCPEVMMGLPAADEVEDTWEAGLKDATPPRPQLADFSEAGEPKGGRRSRAAKPVAGERPITESLPPAETGDRQQTAAGSPQMAPMAATNGAASPPATAKPYSFADQYGEVFEFEDVPEAVTSYASLLEGCRNSMQALEATWQKGARLLWALRDRGHNDAADALNDEYARLLEEAERAAEAARPAASGPAPSANVSRETSSPAYDVAVPMREGMQTNQWYMAARAKLKEMTETQRPPVDYTRYREVNKAALEQLKGQLRSWYNKLDEELRKGAAAGAGL